MSLASLESLVSRVSLASLVASSATSLRYRYDGNDVFRLSSTQITATAFRNELAAAADGSGSTVSILYNADPAGVSEFTSVAGLPTAFLPRLGLRIGDVDGQPTVEMDVTPDVLNNGGMVQGGVIATLVDAGYYGRIARVASKDSFIPLGDAANLVLLSEDEIETAALNLIG